MARTFGSKNKDAHRGQAKESRGEHLSRLPEYLPPQTTTTSITLNDSGTKAPTSERLLDCLLELSSSPDPSVICDLVEVVTKWGSFTPTPKLQELISWLRGLDLINMDTITDHAFTPAEITGLLKRLAAVEKKRQQWMAEYDEHSREVREVAIPIHLLPPLRYPKEGQYAR
jgi:hypothetical protein